MTLGEGQRAGISVGKQRFLARATALPDRANGMDDMARRQSVTLGDLGLARFAAAERAAFGE